jgi:hypothetical protein
MVGVHFNLSDGKGLVWLEIRTLTNAFEKKLFGREKFILYIFYIFFYEN